ncbi:MerR family transcriptional regulator [Actinomadura sp. ATCC 39365]
MRQDTQGLDRPYLRSGQVAERAGVNLQTLRYYERRGLIAEPTRSPGGHRAYPPETVTLLTVIKAAQRLGFTLEEVAELLDTGRRGHPTPDLRARAQAKIAEVEARIADLTTIRAALAEVVSAGCDSLTHCTCPDCPLPFADLAEGRLPERTASSPPCSGGSGRTAGA